MSIRTWIVPHTHWDREWYLSFQDFRWKLTRALDRIIDTLLTNPSFAHFMLDGQTVLLDDYVALRPERRASLEALVAAGRLSVGPWYVQPDDILVTGEALIRNLQKGMASARSLGKPMMIGYLPDSFGHIGSLPALLNGFGIDTAAFMRGPGPEIDKVFFEWSSRDGSRVLVAYLIDGYGNGAELPTEAGSLGAALDELRQRQEGALFPDVPLLVMNGIDHRSIDSSLPRMLDESGLLAETRIGSLGDYIESFRGILPSALPHWKGELRSVYRCPITVGCTSVRQWIKREDQAISALLERRAEPLSAMAFLLGGEYPSTAIDLAWKYLLLNQPHDSICGCSIDAVHQDMRYRYAQARALALNAAADAARFIADKMGGARTPSNVVVAVNPAPARTARALSFACGEAPPEPVLQDPAGGLLPVQIVSESGESALFFDERFRPAQLRLALGLVRNGEIMSYRVHDARTSWESESVLRVDLTLAEGGVSGFDWNAWIAATLPLLNSKGLATIHAVGTRHGKKLVLFSSDLPAFGARSFVLRSRGPAESPPAETDLRVSASSLENDHYRVRVLRDGSLEVLDKKSRAVYQGLGGFVDSGDLGDEYNFDAPPMDTVVRHPRGRLGLMRPVQTQLVERGPVRATLRIETVYRVPISLAPDRRARSKKTALIRTVRLVSLAAGASRIEIREEIDNTARDHRVRVHFPLPGLCAASDAGGTFEIVRRSCHPETLPPRESRGGVASDLSQERPPTTHPFTGFVAAPWTGPDSGAQGTLAVLSRGSREYELLENQGRSELAVTLFRSVGWLSRADLVSRTGHAGIDIPTPEAQEQGHVSFDYALSTRAETATALQQEWEDYRCPADVVIATAVRGDLGTDVSLVEVLCKGVTFSSLTRSASGRLSLRLFEHEGMAQSVTLRFLFPAHDCWKTRLDGSRLSEITLSQDGRSGAFDVAPFEIVTLEIETFGALRAP